MSAYNEEFNKDNVVLRYIIVATLAELKSKIYYYNQIDEDTQKKIEIPFYYSVTGNERFLLDNFLYDTTAEGKAVGDYELVPRGVMELNSMAIQSGNLTNKFVRAELVKELEGELKTFSLMTAFLPVTIGMGVTIVCSNNLEMLKATESIISRLYKSQSFQVDLGMFKVQAAMMVPEDYNQERLIEYALNDKKEFKVTFDLEIQSFIPVFEYGIPLSEITHLVKDSANNPDRDGIGVFRQGAIYFGNVLEGIEHNIDDIRKSPYEGLRSNMAYNDPNKIKSGPQFSKDDVDANPPPIEDEDSRSYRNAGGKEDPGAEDDLADK